MSGHVRPINGSLGCIAGIYLTGSVNLSYKKA